MNPNSSFQQPKRQSILFIISAPSGTGKTSLCKEAARSVPALSFSISHTTRLPRPGEKNGTDYYFISPEEFKQRVAEDRMAEWTEIYGNCYGTATDSIGQLLDRGCDIIFDIDERGARQLTEKYPGSVTILILPPSLEELRKRLKERRTEDTAGITKRLKQAQEEIKIMAWYQYIVVNDCFDDAVAQIAAIITAERCRRNRSVIEAIIQNDEQTG